MIWSCFGWDTSLLFTVEKPQVAVVNPDKQEERKLTVDVEITSTYLC